MGMIGYAVVRTEERTNMQFNATATKTFAVGAALTLALVGCGANNSSQASSSASSSSASASSSSVVEQKEAIISWTNAGSAEEAAKGAGLDKFGVIPSLTLDGKEFKDPKFSYAGGVAQAVYETDGVKFILRKGASGHTTPLTDRDLTSFKNKETTSIDGTDVTEYGAAHGASTVLTWNENSYDYGVTYQAADKGDASIDAKEVDEIVRAIKGANAAAQQQNNSSSSQQQNSSSSSSSSQQQGSGSQQQGVNDAQAQADANSAAKARYNALASNGLTDSVSDAAVSWQGDHWLVTFTYNDTFFEVDCDNEGVVLAQREYQNGVKVEYGQNNEGVVNQEEIDTAGQETRTEEGSDEGNISAGENGDGSNG